MLSIHLPWYLNSFSVVSFLSEGNRNAQKYMTSHKWSQNFMQPYIFGCTKRYDPHPICTSPSPVPKHSTPTPLYKHLLISAFWCGVVKDREAPFRPNYVRQKNIWGLMLLLVVFYLQVLWSLILGVIYTAPIVTFRLYECNHFQMFFSPYDQKSVS